jgi:class 3 adenylate cyclase/tetratricopeptide (TPR) repeat protein
MIKSAKKMEGIKMRCPKCQFVNRKEAKFCIDCGNELKNYCSKCSHHNPPKSKFCEECGSKLSLPSYPALNDSSFDDILIKIQKYLPKGLTKKILSQKDRIEGERKHVTVMFCDLEGFTKISDKLGPEESYSVMNQVYEILIHKVHDYEGTVNEMTGDGIMALFGAPIALEDAPQRAIRSAYAIHREMARFSESIKQENHRIPPLKMRIGIHTGHVVVGALGNDLRVEFKAVGDTVNLASRIEEFAEPGSTYVSKETFQLTDGIFRFEALGKYPVKGKIEAVKIFRVLGHSSQRTRFDVSAERGLTPFLGRERECEILLDGFERAKEGQGHAFSIISEAGIGKSRLLYEFRKAVANENATFLEGKCLSFSRGIAYHPVMDIVKSSFDIVEGDNDFEITGKLKKGLKIIKTNEASTLPYLLEILNVTEGGVNSVSMSPEAKKYSIIEALIRIAIQLSKIRPLIAAIEDLHWIDKSSEDTLNAMLESISGERIFLIFTYRPEYVPTWGPKSYHSQVNLNRLSNRECLTMISHLFGTERIDVEIEKMILEKTEGVPFFVEEFIKSLKDIKVIEIVNDTYHLIKDANKVTIPSTIQDIIMARVDSLPEGAKRIIQIAAVIERVFKYELINQVCELSEEELLSNLSILKDAEIIFERGIFPNSIYTFRHALIQEVVYELTISSKKKELHSQIGQAIERLYKDNIHDYYEVLAEHFIKGEKYNNGAKYSRLADRKAEKSASFGDAIEYVKKRIKCLERLPQTDDLQKEIIDARTVLGLYYVQMGYHTEAKESVLPIIELAKLHDYKQRLSQIYTILGTYNYLVQENFPEAIKDLEEALRISEEMNDNVSLLFANFWLAIVRSVNCEYEKAICQIDKALEINVMAKSLWGISVIKSNLSLFIYYFQGKVNKSYLTSDEALQVANESGDIFSKAMAYVCHGISCFGKGFFEKANIYLSEGCDYCEKINLIIFNSLAQFYLGEVHFETEEFKEAKEHYEKAIQLLEHNRIIPSWKNIFKTALMRAKVANKEISRNLDFSSLYSIVKENNVKVWNGWIHSCIAEIFLKIDIDRIDEAENLIKKAIEIDKSNEVSINLGKSYVLYAEIFTRKGSQIEAKEHLKKAIEIFRGSGADGWAVTFEKELASLK